MQPKLLTVAALAAAVSACALSQAFAAPPVRSSDPRIGRPIPTPDLKPLSEPRLPFRSVKGPVPPNGEKFANVGSVAVLPSGNLLVFNRNPAIMMAEYTPDFRFVRAFNPNIAVNAHGLRLDRHGNIWAIDSYLNVVWKLNPQGEPLKVFGKRGEVGPWDSAKWNGMFNQPLDIAFDEDDNFYVVQGHAGTSEPVSCTYCATYSNTSPPVTQGSDPRVMKFDGNGRLLSTIALPHGPDERYPFIHTVIVTRKGEVWVGDRQENKILVFDRELRRQREVQLPILTSGLTVDPSGGVWLASGMDGVIAKLDDDGKIAGWFGEAGRSPDPDSPLIGEAHYLAVSPDLKTVYIADSANAKVGVFRRD